MTRYGGVRRKVDTKPHNAYYDRPGAVLLTDLASKTVLDAACGTGVT